MAKQATITPSIKVSLLQNQDASIKSLLEDTLDKADFVTTLEQERLQAQVEKADFRILIKPDLELFDHRASTGTDPQIVELLIDLLNEQGYSNIVVASAEDDSSLWLENRDMLSLADLVGYCFVTDQGHTYDVENLSESLTDGGFPPGSILAGTPLSSYWQEAHFRIVFCKNKTHEEQGYALGLQSLLAILPQPAKTFHYRHRLKQEEVALDLFTHTKVHFAIIDAWESNHGSLGNAQPHPLATHTFIASPNLLLADWIGALKMGLDPYVSSINATVFRKLGLPKNYTIKGDLSPYPAWKNVPIHLRESAYKRNESPLAQRLAKVCLLKVNTELFPFKNVVEQQLNSVFSNHLQNIDLNPTTYWVLFLLNTTFANLDSFQKGWKTLFDKDQLNRVDARLNIDLSQLKPADFAEIEHYILPLQTILRYTLPDQNGLRRRYLDGSVIFEYTRIIPVPYEDFIQKVDICQAVQMMYDNIGGTRVSIKTDQQGRVIHQAERDIYLPQPNWMVLFGGKHIDVDKIELIKYEDEQQQNFWRTLSSANQSADYDDGMLTFAKDPGGVRIEIIARQKFELPLFWQVVNLDYVPVIKERVVSDAYNLFFSRTIANFEAAYEGRSPYVGKTLTPLDNETLPYELDHLKGLFSMLVNFFKNWTNQDNTLAGFAETNADENGFRHFTVATTTNHVNEVIPQFFKELLTAVTKDIQLLNPK